MIRKAAEIKATIDPTVVKKGNVKLVVDTPVEKEGKPASNSTFTFEKKPESKLSLSLQTNVTAAGDGKGIFSNMTKPETHIDGALSPQKSRSPSKQSLKAEESFKPTEKRPEEPEVKKTLFGTDPNGGSGLFSTLKDNKDEAPKKTEPETKSSLFGLAADTGKSAVSSLFSVRDDQLRICPSQRTLHLRELTAHRAEFRDSSQISEAPRTTPRKMPFRKAHFLEPMLRRRILEYSAA